jgi:dihydroorotase
MTNRLIIRRPDDWHVHLRDGAVLQGVASFTARQFARAIVMPNLSPPITTVAAARAYRERIVAAAGPGFTPLMTAYLTDGTDPEEIARGHVEAVFTAAKLYPAHATTGSAHGVTDVANIRSVLERMERIGLPLLVHGEVTDAQVDIFDREAVFIERVLAPLVRDLPGLKVVFEHITTAEAAAFVAEAGPNVAATITPQHLHANGTGWRCVRRQLRAVQSSSSAPTAPRTRLARRKPPAAVQVSSTRPMHWKATSQSSTRKARLTGSRVLPRSMDRRSMACRSTQKP